MTQGIYKLTNNINDKVYIGQSVDIEKRFKDHLNNLINNKHHAFKLQRFYNKCKNGKSFEIKCVILEEVKNENHLTSREQYYIELYDSYKNGYNSVELNGDPTKTKKREIISKKVERINANKEEFNYLKNQYKNNLYLQFAEYNDTYLYRVNEAIKYFVKNYNLDLYKAEISQYKHKINLFIIDKNFMVVQEYIYSSKNKSMGLSKYTYRYINSNRRVSWEYNRYKMFDNITKAKNRYKWFLKKYAELDNDIIKYNTIKYSKNKYSIRFKQIREIIGYEYGDKFRKHIIEDIDIQKLSEHYGIHYPNGCAELNISSTHTIKY